MAAIERLVADGASPDAKDEHGIPAVCVAAWSCHADAVSALAQLLVIAGYLIALIALRPFRLKIVTVGEILSSCLGFVVYDGVHVACVHASSVGDMARTVMRRRRRKQ